MSDGLVLYPWPVFYGRHPTTGKWRELAVAYEVHEQPAENVGSILALKLLHYVPRAHFRGALSRIATHKLIFRCGFVADECQFASHLLGLWPVGDAARLGRGGRTSLAMFCLPQPLFGTGSVAPGVH